MSLTHEQKELLRAVAQVYASGDHGSFTFIKTIDEVDTGRLMYGRHANVVVHSVDESDFIYLEKEGLLTLRRAGGDLGGKPTSKGINVAMRWIPADQRTQPPPGLDTPRSSPPPRTQPPPGGAAVTGGGMGVEEQRICHVIFIGHGRSKEWLELERYLIRDLRLNSEEFNAKPAAGYTTQQHLEEMLNRATFAFLVMTAEDVHQDGTVHARENVVHEAGLFQGRLGFPKAVLLVEAGCALPSNLDGLTHIAFPKNHIAGAFHDVRRMLVDRRIISGL